MSIWVHPEDLESIMDWHPRQNVRSKQWICSNGRWGTIYGVIEQHDVHRKMLWTQVYRAWSIHESIQTDLGEFATGDAAAEACWETFMARIRRVSGGQPPQKSHNPSQLNLTDVTESAPKAP